jgi:hypothetical protein
MKIPISALILLALVANGVRAQSPTTQSQVNVPAPTPYAIVNQDANSRVWQRQEYEAGPNGEIVTNIQAYKEYATGLNYLDANSHWESAKEDIEIQPDGTAAALLGQHKVFFPIDISNGRITLVTPEGLQVSSEPLELSYWDGTNTVVLAELTNSIGVLVGNNQVVYPNAFAGLKADIRYTFTLAGLEQDVIIKQQPLTPEFYNLNPASCRIQMVTEFFNSPNATATTTTLPQQAGISLVDQNIGFGTMQMVLGHAFLLGQSAAELGALVAKSWLETGGMQFLVEEIPVNAIADGLAALPLTAMNTGSSKASYLASRRVVLPQHKPERTSGHKIMLAKSRITGTGFVLDYQTINSTLTNVTFQGDETFFISGPTYLYGTSTFESGSILKYTNNNNASLILESTNLNWYGSSYRPVVFTAMDDNSVGVSINGSSGSPTNYYGNPVLNFTSLSAPFAMSHARIEWAALAISTYSSDLYFYDSQFVNCLLGFKGVFGGVYLRNTLFANVLTNFCVGDMTADFQNTTFAGSSCVAYGVGDTTMNITNCVFANIGIFATNSSGLSPSADYNGFYNCGEFGSDVTTNPTSPFQTVGAGSYYLASGGNFHNAGTTNIDPMLLASLPQTTTYPPLVYSNQVINVPTALSPQAQRDNTGNPALGYHYDVLDYVFGGCDLYTNLSFSAGTAVGWFMNQGGVSSSGQPYGFSLNSGASFTTIGTATAPCWVVDYNNVQEGAGPWSNMGWMGAIMLNGNGTGPTPQINSTFTKWGEPASTLFFRDNWDHGAAAFADCEFYDGYIATYDTSFLYFTNCLFDRDAIQCYDQDTTPVFTMLNCTFHDGDVVLGRNSGLGTPFWTIENSSFDGTAFGTADYLNGSSAYTLFNYNAYNTNNLSWQSYPQPYIAPTNFLEVVGPNDQMATNYNWESSWFGAFYLPTNSPLLRMGSTNANLLGLYHFTTQTNQVIEGTNLVTIGYHYVATDTNGVPLDSNGDGIPDYIEDANGNGSVDSGEIGWNLTNDLGLQVIISQPVNGTSLP